MSGEPYIGPRGGKWANAQHTIPWKAPEVYVSPAQRELTSKEATTRQIAIRLGRGEPEAIEAAAAAMVSHVEPGAVLIPLPSSDGSTATMRKLAEALAKLAGNGAEVVDVLGRSSPVESSRERRTQGQRGLKPHQHGIVLRGDVPTGRPVQLVDNVYTTGSTAMAAAMALTGHHPTALVYAKADEVLASRTLTKSGGPYVGPRGGLWADPEHTIHWTGPGVLKVQPHPTLTGRPGPEAPMDLYVSDDPHRDGGSEYNRAAPGKVWVGLGSNANTYMAQMPKESLSGFVGDVQGHVPPEAAESDHPVLKALAAGEGTLLGKGDDGIVFRVGDKVVKASTTVPFQPFNPGHLTPAQARDRLREQVRVDNHLHDLGVPTLKSEFVEAGGRGFQIKPYVEIPERFTQAQLDEAQEGLHKMHDAGYVMNDDVQIGLLDGKVVFFDTGKAGVARPLNGKDKYDHWSDYGDDMSRLAGLYLKHQGQFVNRRQPSGIQARDKLNAMIAKIKPGSPTDFYLKLLDKMYQLRTQEAWSTFSEQELDDELEAIDSERELMELAIRHRSAPKIEKSHGSAVTVPYDIADLIAQAHETYAERVHRVHVPGTRIDSISFTIIMSRLLAEASARGADEVSKMRRWPLWRWVHAVNASIAPEATRKALVKARSNTAKVEVWNGWPEASIPTMADPDDDNWHGWVHKRPAGEHSVRASSAPSDDWGLGATSGPSRAPVAGDDDWGLGSPGVMTPQGVTPAAPSAGRMVDPTAIMGGRPPPTLTPPSYLTAAEKGAWLTAAMRAGDLCRGLGNYTAAKTGTWVAERWSGGQLTQDADPDLRAKMLDVIRGAVKRAVEEGWTADRLASELGNQTGQWARNWRRIARTELRDALSSGVALNAAAVYGARARVMRVPDAEACEHCTGLFLRPDGRPFIWNVDQLVSYGTNAGRKQADWKPTLGPVHPNCRCDTQIVPPGFDVDDRGLLIPMV